MAHALRVASLAAALLAAGPASAGISESWYLARGAANMKIGNYAAAVEAYEKALAANPRSREASRALGTARQRNGETDRAVAEYDRHLRAFPEDADVAFEQARLLQWSRYAYRAKDAVRYLRMGLAVRDDPARRRDLARLLARDRASLDEALAEYGRLVAAAPADEVLREERLRLLLWDPRHREEARRELEARVRARPEDAKALRELARLEAADPARAAEAAARYERLLAGSPADPELRLGLARALARAGRRAEAREAYAGAVAASPTLEARLERAELLAADPATRDEARAELEAILRVAPHSRRARLDLSRVLLARKDTSLAAAAGYEQVLREAPRDPEAHLGLARAYAWNGDPDRALAHGELAGRYGGPAPEVATLERSLRRGREPSLGGGARVLDQPSGSFPLRSIGTFLTGSTSPSAFTAVTAESGVAFHAGPAARAEGPFATAAGDWRPRAGDLLRLRLGWDASRLAGEASGEARWERQGDGRLSLGIAHQARQDSYRALAGEVVGGALRGAASDTLADLRLDRADDGGGFHLAVRAGAVTGSGFDATFTAGATGRADRALLRAGGWSLLGGGRIEGTHHARDLSGLRDADPLAPGLFSPPLFLTASPRLALVRDAGVVGRLALDAGPSLQVTAGPGGGTRLGGDALLSASHRFGDRLRASLDGQLEYLPSTYMRAELSAALAVLF
ncbi:MAG TPA: tetratricopeptide repeat protein [Anaeromyxobacter sp.]